MAIKLDKILPSGVVANYWRISSVRFERDGGAWFCHVLLHLFLSENEAKSGKMPISIEGRRIDMSVSANTDDIIGSAYQFLKASDEFSSSVDC